MGLVRGFDEVTRITNEYYMKVIAKDIEGGGLMPINHKPKPYIELPPESGGIMDEVLAKAVAKEAIARAKPFDTPPIKQVRPKPRLVASIARRAGISPLPPFSHFVRAFWEMVKHGW